MEKRICEFSRQTRFEDLPDKIRALMKRSLLDTLGVGAVGSRTQIAQIVRTLAQQQFAAGEDSPCAHILFNNAVVSPTGAAMAGAFSIDSIDAHDGNSAVKGHAGSAILPALVAVTEGLKGRGIDFSGQDFLTAMAIGYEIAYRAGLALHATVPDYHTSGAWTAVGIAVMCARILELDDTALLHAAGIAEYHGPRSQMMRCIDHPTMVRDGVGWGAPTGVSAAYLAALGFTGAPAITLCGEDAAPYWQDLGQNWEIFNTHYKRYPVCRWAHPAIDAARMLMRTHNNISSKNVTAVRIRTFDYAARLAGHAPKNLDELSYALAYPVATMIVRGQMGVPELEPEALHDQEILRLSNATQIEATEHYTRISVGKRWADVRLLLDDGNAVESVPCAPKGDPQEPLSDAEISEKFHLFADTILGAERSGEIESRVAGIDEQGADLFGLLDCLRAPQ